MSTVVDRIPLQTKKRTTALDRLAQRRRECQIEYRELLVRTDLKDEECDRLLELMTLLKKSQKDAQDDLDVLRRAERLAAEAVGEAEALAAIEPLQIETDEKYNEAQPAMVAWDRMMRPSEYPLDKRVYTKSHADRLTECLHAKTAVADVLSEAQGRLGGARRKHNRCVEARRSLAALKIENPDLFNWDTKDDLEVVRLKAEIAMTAEALAAIEPLQIETDEKRAILDKAREAVRVRPTPGMYPKEDKERERKSNALIKARDDAEAEYSEVLQQLQASKQKHESCVSAQRRLGRLKIEKPELFEGWKPKGSK